MEDECPKFTKRKNDPKTEVWHVDYGESCGKSGEYKSMVKKSGKEACCVDPPQSPLPNLVSFSFTSLT